MSLTLRLLWSQEVNFGMEYEACYLTGILDNPTLGTYTVTDRKPDMNLVSIHFSADASVGGWWYDIK
jgi:hypothetical protein